MVALTIVVHKFQTTLVREGLGFSIHDTCFLYSIFLLYEAGSRLRSPQHRGFYSGSFLPTNTRDPETRRIEVQGKDKHVKLNVRFLPRRGNDTPQTVFGPRQHTAVPVLGSLFASLPRAATPRRTRNPACERQTPPRLVGARP